MDQPNDLLKARTEAALLLRLDPSNLSPSDTLRCDLIASLRLVVDDASTSVLDGRAPDLARLLTATESLIRLLPSEPPKPESAEHDPREIMWRAYLESRRRGALNGEGIDGAKLTIERLKAELAAKDARIAELEAGAPAPAATNVAPAPADNVVALPRATKPAPPPPASQYELVPANEPWREYSHLFE